MSQATFLPHAQRSRPVEIPKSPFTPLLDHNYDSLFPIPLANYFKSLIFLLAPFNPL
jgi:hypothetical protein